MDWLVDNPWAIWLSIAVFLAVIEMFSLDLVLLMFAIGAACAAAASAIGAPLWLAIGIFAVVSALLLAMVRPPLVAKLHGGPTLRQGPENFVGDTAVVLSPTSEFDGRIRVNGEVWSARVDRNTRAIDAGAEVVVVRIDGATAIVAPTAT